MGLYYNHTLIPKPKTFLPTTAQVGRFLALLAQVGVVPPDADVSLRAYTGKTRKFNNPFTREIDIVPWADHINVPSIDQIEVSIATLLDYEIEIHGMGRPKTAPLPVIFDGPYHASVTCIVGQVLRSTSDLHEESGVNMPTIPYRKPCPAELAVGLFSNPHNLEVIEVPDAGCAEFWIEFGIGKDIFPPMEQGNLAILNPAIVQLAEAEFGVEFVQGCHWG